MDHEEQIETFLAWVQTRPAPELVEVMFAAMALTGLPFTDILAAHYRVVEQAV